MTAVLVVNIFFIAFVVIGMVGHLAWAVWSERVRTERIARERRRSVLRDPARRRAPARIGAAHPAR